MILNYLESILDWCKIKIPLADKRRNILFKEGEIWWCSIGMNIGVEIYGKGVRFARPVVVFKKFSEDSFLGVPLTTRLKASRWHVSVWHGQRERKAILSQIRAFDSRRLIKRMATLSDTGYANLRNEFLSQYGS